MGSAAMGSDAMGSEAMGSEAMGLEATGSGVTGSGATADGAFFFSIAGWGARVGWLGFLEKVMGCERRGYVREL
jgi:hypothetical protein